NDQRIVLALAAALMPLALAALLGVAFQVRRLVRRRAEQRAAEEARALAAYALADDLDGQDGKPLDDEIVSPDAAGAVDELDDIQADDLAALCESVAERLA